MYIQGALVYTIIANSVFLNLKRTINILNNFCGPILVTVRKTYQNIQPYTREGKRIIDELPVMCGVFYVHKST